MRLGMDVRGLRTLNGGLGRAEAKASVLVVAEAVLPRDLTLDLLEPNVHPLLFLVGTLVLVHYTQGEWRG